MPTYTYKAKKGPTELVSGQIEADSQGSAIDKITEMGLVPIKVIEEERPGRVQDKAPEQDSQDRAPSVFTPLPSGSLRLKAKDVDIFTRQLASMVKSGVPILRALSLIAQQAENKALKSVVAALEKEIRNGMMFSEAISKYPQIFSNLYLNMVRAGERSGALYEVLYNLAEYRQKEQDVRQKVQAALAYPLLMLAVGVATIFIMLTFFLPKFINLFENMNQALPLSTRVLIKISGFMGSNWYWFLIALVLLIAVFGRTRSGSKKKLVFDFAKLHLPFIKTFTRDAEVAKFTRTLSLLIKNGISVCDGLELATDVLDNDALKDRLKQSRLEIINQGCTLSESLNKIDVFPAFAVNMISVGEEGGKIEESLKDISDVYEREVEQSMKIATTLLEPMLILIVGGIVGFIVFAMLLPIFNIGIVVR